MGQPSVGNTNTPAWKDVLGASFIFVGGSYAVAYCANLGFWGAFGLSPAQVGLIGTELLGRLSLGAVWIAIFGVAYAVVATVFLHALFKAWLPLPENQWPNSWRAWCKACLAQTPLLATILAVIWLGYLLLFGLTDVSFELGTLVPMGVFTVAVVVLSILRTPAAVNDRLAAQGHRTPRLSLFGLRATTALIVATLFCIQANQWMYGIGTNLSTGKRSNATFVIGLTPPIARITWLEYRTVPDTYAQYGGPKKGICTTNVTCPGDRPLLLLGVSSDAFVAYDCKAQATYFLRRTDVKVDIFPIRYKGPGRHSLPGILDCQQAPRDANIVLTPQSFPPSSLGTAPAARVP